MTIPQKIIEGFQKEILTWYAKHKRDLPWREVPFDTSLQCRDPYKILVSEVMLQQTQVSRVMPKYEAWLEKFPTVQSLAGAKISEVLQMWSGLGYNRRALNLQRCAQEIVKYSLQKTQNTQRVGMSDTQIVRDSDISDVPSLLSIPKVVWPRTEAELIALPGIGKYTARALMCFAFDEQVAVVDTNVRKVILRRIKKQPCLPAGRELRSKENKTSNLDSCFLLHDSEREKVMTDKEIWQLAEKLLPIGRAYEWNQALMDYAGVVLKNEKIAIPKQSKFIGSHRYYRGRVLKALLLKRKIAIKDLGVMLKDDYSDKDWEWLERLVGELREEGFIRVESQIIHLR